MSLHDNKLNADIERHCRESGKFGSFFCNESCGHSEDVWLADEDKWFCNDCIIDYWVPELNVLTADIFPHTLDSEAIVIKAIADLEDEFTHFVVTPLNDESRTFEVSLHQLESERK